VRRVLKALPYARISYYPITLSDYIYILDEGVAKDSIIGRSDVFSKREVSKVESDEKERGENIPDVYLALALPRLHDTSPRVGSN
jgi:hypothetical protein